MSTVPFVSVVLCTFNGEKFIAEQVQSIIDQTYSNLEILISDDASTDATVQIIRSFEDHRIRLHINTENQGYAGNFAKALAMSSGEYISLSDQDDIWEPDKIKKLLAFFAASPCSLAYHDSVYIDEEGHFTGENLSETSGYVSGSGRYLLAYNNCVAGHAMLFEAGLKDSIFPVPLDIPHDHWIAHVALQQKGICFLPEALVRYRQHGLSITDILNTRERDSKEKAEKKNRDFDDRIKNLQAMRSYKGNSTEDIRFYNTFLHLLEHRTNNRLALFSFLYHNRQQLFNIYHKKGLSLAFRIFKIAFR